MPDEMKAANPALLGLACFGLTTVVLSTINAGLLPVEALPAVVPLAFSFGGFAQIIAGVMEFKNGNTFGTVAFTSYGAFWWWYSFLLWTIGAGWIKPPDPHGVDVALLMWGVFTLYMWIATFRTNFTLWTIFCCSGSLFFCSQEATSEWGRSGTSSEVGSVWLQGSTRYTYHLLK